MISAGAIFNGDNRIKAYGTVNKTLKAGTPIKDGYEFDSKIGFVYSGLIKGMKIVGYLQVLYMLDKI